MSRHLGASVDGHRSGRPDGPMLAVCQGDRCRALWRLAGTDGLFKATVASTPGAVLIAADCLGPCHLGAVAAIARHNADTGGSGPTLWLSGVEQAARGEALRCWVASGGPAATEDPLAPVPPVLSEAVICQGPSIGPLVRRHRPGSTKH